MKEWLVCPECEGPIQVSTISKLGQEQVTEWRCRTCGMGGGLPSTVKVGTPRWAELARQTRERLAAARSAPEGLSGIPMGVGPWPWSRIHRLEGALMPCYTVCFDITEDRVRTRVGKRLLQFGDRVQKSVFEIQIASLQELQRLREELREEIEDGDDIRFYRLCLDCRKASMSTLE